MNYLSKPLDFDKICQNQEATKILYKSTRRYRHFGQHGREVTCIVNCWKDLKTARPRVTYVNF